MTIEIKNAADLVAPWTAWFLYGPTGCIAGDAFIPYTIRKPNGKHQNGKGGTMERLYYRVNGIRIPGKGSYQRPQTIGSKFFVPSMDEDQRIALREIAAVTESGIKTCVRVQTMGGRSIVCTADHPFATTAGFKPVAELGVGALVLVHSGVAWSAGDAKKVRTQRPHVYVKHHPHAATRDVHVSSRGYHYDYEYKQITRARAVLEAHMNGLTLDAYVTRLNDGALDGLQFIPPGHDVHHKDENPLNDVPENLVALTHGEHAAEHTLDNLKYMASEDEIISIEDVGPQMTYDIAMKDAPHNFVAEGFVVHNSAKTTSAATFPYPFFIVPRNEQSIMTLRGLNMPYTEVDTPEEMHQAITYLETQQRVSAQLLAQAQQLYAAGKQAEGDAKNLEAWDAFPYQTVVVEAISHYTDLIIEALSGTKGGWLSGKMDQQKWGQLGSHLRNIHVRLRAMPVHVVYAALDSIKENDAGVAAGGPLMSGAMAYKLPSACDAIVYMEQLPGVLPRRAHFQKRGVFPARIRVPQGVTVPPFVDDFSWEKVKHLFGH